MRGLSVEETRLWRRENVSRSTWKRQITCHTPLDRLPWFTDLLVKHLAPFDRALLIVDQVVFAAPELEALRRAAGETRIVPQAPGHVFGGDAEELRHALEVVLGGWIDFRLLLGPSGNALRADHDEFTTFFAMSPGRIAALRETLRAWKVRIVEDWTAEDP